MSSFALSMVGSGVAVTRTRRPPAATIARLISRMFTAATPFALGCTLNTSELPADTMEMVLLITVEVGLVVGVIAATTPKGANSVTTMPWSPVAASSSRSSGPGVLSVTRRFLTSLSPTRPSPVSARAISASRSAFSSMACRIEAMMAFRPSSPIRRYSWNARDAAATASSIVGKIPSPSSVRSASASDSAARRPEPASGPAWPSRRRTRSMISWTSCSDSVFMAHRSPRSLVEPLLALDLPGVHDGHDHGVARPVPGGFGLPCGAARGHQDHLVHARTHGVRGHHEPAGLVVVHVQVAHHQELQPVHGGLLAARHQGSGHSSEEHVRNLPHRPGAPPAWGRPRARLAIASWPGPTRPGPATSVRGEAPGRCWRAGGR